MQALLSIANRAATCILIFLCCLLSLQSLSQPHVANWKTWIINTNELMHAAPPGKDATGQELKQVKQLQSSIDANGLRQVRYWDAGAPSYHWNEIGYQLAGPQLFTKDGGNFWRGPTAWMNIAMYDATIAAWKMKYQYNRKRPYELDASIRAMAGTSGTPSYPCEHAVSASAAAHVLAYFYPALGDSLIAIARQAGHSRILAGVQFPSDVAEGWELGKKVAMMVIEKAKADGTAPWPGSIPNDPKLWTGSFPVGAHAANIKPLVLQSGKQFRPAAPPDFTNEMKEMKEFKQNFYTASQAYRWGSVHGLDVWTDLASQKIFEHHLERNTPEAVRIYTVLHVALHDATIAIMDAKYAYFGIRPDQFDKEYKPLIGRTPPFPGYPSGHATAAFTAATVLAYFFPDDAAHFKKLAKDCATSRFYAGVHFTTDNVAGTEMGEKIGSYVIDSWARKDGSK
ncbi:MAG TPA: phosphatase PAP2 family protein [Chitinophagaceae bacterium]|nr:phosphatase PAP2 family protein [Chitinophagaceae bacterium]